MPIYNRALSDYIVQNFAVEDDILSQIHSALALHGLPTYSINAEEGRFLQFLVRASGAKSALELGTLGGYSAIWIARGLPEDGRLITIEKEQDHAALAQEHFKLAGLDHKVEIRKGDARALLPTLHDVGPFDFVFIDADNSNYPSYLDLILDHLRPGGIIAAHNAFVHGMILEKDHLSPYVEGTRRFNHAIAADPRLIATIFPAGDGMLVAVLNP
jgi:predicted O-methyltransferase YrrM